MAFLKDAAAVAGLEAGILGLSKTRNQPIAVLEVYLTLATKEQNRFVSATTLSRRLRPAINRTKTMKAIRTSVVLSLLLTLAGGAALVAQADDQPVKQEKETPATPTPPAAPKKPVQQQLTGTVVAVDKFTKTVTLQVNNLSYVLQITDSTRVSKNDQEKSIVDVVVGEEIKVNVVLRELPNGRVEVAVLSVELPAATASQGNAGGAKFTQPPPFQNGPNPANVDGPIISRNR